MSKKAATKSTAKAKTAKAKKGKRVMRGGGGYAALVGGAAAAASRGSCPPGVMCLSSGLSLFLIVAALFVALAIAYMYITRPAAQNTIRVIDRGHEDQRPINVRVSVPQQDGRYAMPPQPLRDWRAQPEFPPRGGLASIPINIPTQGLPESFQSIGVMTLPDGKVLPLMGRRTAGSNDRWNYYTRTDTYNPVPLPLEYNKRDCMDDTGCNEVFSGDALKLGPTGETATVSVYKYDGPKYIPGLI